MIRCRWIRPDLGGPDGLFYREACALREEVLLRPVGLSFDEFAARYGDEPASEHVVALARDGKTPRVVGVSLLRPGDPEAAAGKVMQVAVASHRRGRGVGRALMAAAADRGQERGFTHLMCHAQDTARAFYERVGWRVEGAPFEEVGIPHVRMIRPL